MKLKLTAYTYLLGQLVSVIDQGASLTIDEAKELLGDIDFFARLQERFRGQICLGIFGELAATHVREKLLELRDDDINERRRFGVSNNGLCLLVAYLVEIVQRGEFELEDKGRPWVC